MKDVVIINFGITLMIFICVIKKFKNDVIHNIFLHAIDKTLYARPEIQGWTIEV